MAIGLDPLIQYVVEGKNGAYQVLSAAYDPKKDEFFDVFNNEPRAPGDWGHWLSGGMNWNSNCAYCHTTDFRKNFKVGDNSYHSGFSAHGVSCLQCHDALPKDCKHSELSELAERPSPAERMYACAVCHSRREQLKDEKFKAGSDFYDYFRPILPVQDGIYYPDGKVRDENFMFSSFMMCRQYQAGLTCLDCHDRHALKTVRPVDKNELCLNCHAPAAKNFKNAPTIIPEAHSFHKGNDGNLCVNCHMPKTIYMARDSRYDHGFTSPDPVLTREAGVPNACSQCHEKIDAGKPGRNLDWLIENFEKWYGSERFLRKRARSMAVARAHAGDVSEALKAELGDAGSADSYNYNPYKNSDFAKMMNGHFVNHPWTINNDPVTIMIEDEKSPITKGIWKRKSFKITEEIYQLSKDFDRRSCRVLLALDVDKSPITTENGKKAKIREDRDIALVFIKKFGKGRVAYFGFGHDARNYKDKGIMKLLMRLVQFACGDLKANVSSIEKPTAD